MTRTILIGDIHGCYDELTALLDLVALTPEDLLVSVGDLVDRGPKPAEVVALFRARPNSVALCGNHERKHVRGVLSYSQQVTREQLGDGYDDAVAWFATLPYFYEDAQVRVVHWGYFPGVPLAEVPDDVLAGTVSGDAKLRERFGDTPWYEHYTDEKPIVFGHAVVGSEALVRGRNVFGIDTGACHGMRLTALVLPEGRLVSVPVLEDHWAHVGAAWQGAVMRTWDWAEMTFEQLDKKVRSLRGSEIADGALDVVTTWAAAVRALLPELARRLDAEVARVLGEVGEADFGRRAAEHPAGSHIVRHRAGKLGRESLGCATPAQVVALAGRLGVEVPCGPTPWPEVGQG